MNTAAIVAIASDDRRTFACKIGTTGACALFGDQACRVNGSDH
jgi:hypothetical protein